jgi:hypothetical protein
MIHVELEEDLRERKKWDDESSNVCGGFTYSEIEKKCSTRTKQPRIINQ